MREEIRNCSAVLLEPRFKTTISLPNEFTFYVQCLASSRRSQVLRFGAKENWEGWDEVKIQMPQSEMHDLIIDLRSMTMGLGTFSWEFDHLWEFSGKEAEKII